MPRELNNNFQTKVPTKLLEGQGYKYKSMTAVKLELLDFIDRIMFLFLCYCRNVLKNSYTVTTDTKIVDRADSYTLFLSTISSTFNYDSFKNGSIATFDKVAKGTLTLTPKVINYLVDKLNNIICRKEFILDQSHVNNNATNKDDPNIDHPKIALLAPFPQYKELTHVNGNIDIKVYICNEGSSKGVKNIAMLCTLRKLFKFFFCPGKVSYHPKYINANNFDIAAHIYSNWNLCVNNSKFIHDIYLEHYVRMNLPNISSLPSNYFSWKLFSDNCNYLFKILLDNDHFNTLDKMKSNGVYFPLSLFLLTNLDAELFMSARNLLKQIKRVRISYWDSKLKEKVDDIYDVLEFIGLDVSIRRRAIAMINNYVGSEKIVFTLFRNLVLE